MVNKIDALKRGTAYHTGETKEKNMNPQIRIDQLEKKIKKDIKLAIEQVDSITLEELKEQLDALWLEIDRTKINALGTSTNLDEKVFKFTEDNKITVEIPAMDNFYNEELTTTAKDGVGAINELKEDARKDLNNLNTLINGGSLVFNLIQANKMTSNMRKLIVLYGTGTNSDLTKIIAMPNSGNNMNQLYMFSISKNSFVWSVIIANSNIYMPQFLYNYFNYILNTRDIGTADQEELEYD